MYLRGNFGPGTSEDYRLGTAVGILLAAYAGFFLALYWLMLCGLFPRSLLVDAAKRRRKSRIGRISAATQDSSALCRFALGATRAVRGACDPCGNRTSGRGRKKQHHRGAEERDKKRGTDSSSTRSPRERAAKSLLGLRFIPIIRFSSRVLIVGLHSLESGLAAPLENNPNCKRRSGRACALSLDHLASGQAT